MLVLVWWGNVQSYPQSMATRCRWARFLGVYSCQKTANKMRSCSNSSTYYHHNHGFIIRTRCFHNWQWEDINSWWLRNNSLPILSTSEYSKIVLGRGSSYDEEYNITHVHVKLGFCRKYVWMKQHSFNPESFQNTWIMTWNYRRKIKIQIDTFIHKTETKSSGSIPTLPSVSFVSAPVLPLARWHSPRPDLRPEARFAPKQDVSSDASAGQSWGMVFQFGQDWTIHRNCPPSPLSPWSYILFQKNLQMWTASSCSCFTIPTRDSKNRRYMFCSPKPIAFHPNHLLQPLPCH